MKIDRICVILSFVGLLSACGQSAKSPEPTTISSNTNQNVLAGSVIGSAQGFNKIKSQPYGLGVALTVSVSSPEASLEIDLNQGSLVVEVNGSSVQCALDADRLQTLQSLMNSSEICQPAPPPAGSLVCDAIATPDIQLSNVQSSVSLSPVVCDHGTFLCDGNDAVLRQLLSSLRSNPPPGCNL